MQGHSILMIIRQLKNWKLFQQIVRQQIFLQFKSQIITLLIHNQPDRIICSNYDESTTYQISLKPEQTSQFYYQRMSHHKFRKPSTSVSLYNVQTTKISDQSTISDYEYLLQQSAQELTRVKQYNEQLLQQLTQSPEIEQLQQELIYLREQIEKKTKTNKKLQNKCKLVEQLEIENQNLKKDYQDIIREKIQNKESKENRKPTKQSYKALEDADKFLHENKVFCTTIQQQQKSPIKQEIIQLVFSDFDLKIAQESEQNIIKDLQIVLIRATSSLNKLIQNNKIDNYLKIINELEKHVLQLNEELWVMQEKYKLQQDLIKDLIQLQKNKDETYYYSLKSFQEQYLQQQQSQLLQEEEEEKQKEFRLEHKSENLNNCQCDKILQESELYRNLQQITSLISQKSELENQKTIKRELQLMKNNDCQIEEKINNQLEELNQIRLEYSQLFREFDDLQNVMQFESGQYINRALNEILEFFDAPDICTQNQNPINRQIQLKIQILIKENNQLKQRFNDLLYKIIVSIIKQSPKSVENTIQSDEKLQDALKWLLQSTKRTNSANILFENADILAPLIEKPQLPDVVNLQMRVIQNLMYALNPGQGMQSEYMQIALRDLKRLNVRFSNV